MLTIQHMSVCLFCVSTRKSLDGIWTKFAGRTANETGSSDRTSEDIVSNREQGNRGEFLGITDCWRNVANSWTGFGETLSVSMVTGTRKTFGVDSDPNGSQSESRSDLRFVRPSTSVADLQILPSIIIISIIIIIIVIIIIILNA